MGSFFKEALVALEKEKGISKEVFLETLKEALILAFSKKYNQPLEAEVKIDIESDKIGIYTKKEVVRQPTKPHQISLKEARNIKKDINYGDYVEVEITPKDFGRIAAETAKRIIEQRIKDIQKLSLYHTYKKYEGNLITGTITKIAKEGVYVDLGKLEGIIPQSELVPYEHYRPGDRIKCYVVAVKYNSSGLSIILSRTHLGLVKYLFMQEVPEISSSIVEIKGIAREPGIRSKISVFSNDSNVTATGACIGPKSSRIQAIMSELQGERIDIIPYKEDIKEFIRYALQPAKVKEIVILDEANKEALVIVPQGELSCAIGKDGSNVKLASKLTSWKINLREAPKEEEEVTVLLKVGKNLAKYLKAKEILSVYDIEKASLTSLASIPHIGEKKALFLKKEASEYIKKKLAPQKK